MKRLLPTWKRAAAPAPVDRREEDLLHIQKVLGQWEAHARTSYKRTPFHGYQLLIEPYVLRKRQSGFDIDFLVATIEGREWWDRLSFYLDLELFHAFRMVRPGDVVFDLGANHGFYSVLLSKMVGPAGKVYGFDPFPLNVDIARFNARLNRLDNIEVLPVGLSKERKETNVSLSMQCVASDSPMDSLTIRLDRLDNYTHLQPDFVKIDIEGAEVDALEGAGKLLRSRPNIYLEVHPEFITRFGRRVEEIFDFLPLDDYISYICYPEKGIIPYRREFPIEHGCSLYLFKEEPCERVYYD